MCSNVCGQGFDARDLTWEPRGGSPKCFSLNDVNINSKVKVYNFLLHEFKFQMYLKNNIKHLQNPTNNNKTEQINKQKT